MIKFRRKIKDLALRFGLSQAEVANRAGIHPQTLNNYLVGRSDMKGENIEKILRVLDKERTKGKRSKKSRRHKESTL